MQRIIRIYVPDTNRSNRHYTHCIPPKRVAGSMSADEHLDNTAPKKQRSGGDTESDLTGLGIEPTTCRVDVSITAPADLVPGRLKHMVNNFVVIG